jgi:hypothetical protein
MGAGRTVVNTPEPPVGADTGFPSLDQQEFTRRPRTKIKPWSTDVLIQHSSRSDGKSCNALHYRLAAAK